MPRGSVRNASASHCCRLDGWNWTGRVKPNIYQWTRLSLREEAFKPSLQRPPLELRQLTPCGQTRGADVTWRVVERPAGLGYFLVGDAAAVLDPASSHGVLKAIMTGMMAAHSILQMVGGADEHYVTKAYCQWIRNWFEYDVAKLTSFYAVFEQPLNNRP